MRRFGNAERLSAKWMLGAVVLVAVVVIGTVAMGEGLDVQKYIANGYSSIGPITVESVSNQTLVLFTAPKNIKINLTGRTVRTVDLSNRSLALSSLKKGARVYVFQKKNEVIVCSLPKKEARNDQ